jgi:hypothetical protein
LREIFMLSSTVIAVRLCRRIQTNCHAVPGTTSG